MAQAKQNVLIKTRTVLLLLLALAAWCSNPDEASFQRWVGRGLQADLVWKELPQMVVAKLAVSAVDTEHTDFGVFSIVRVFGTDPRTFVGCFGNWFVLPSLDPLPNGGSNPALTKTRVEALP